MFEERDFIYYRYVIVLSDETAPAPVGLGGRKVTVEEMKVGGSGSRTAMNGVIVEKETFRTKYVINCAGGYSDAIAAMIGDTSFKIKPRLGMLFCSVLFGFRS